jgi:hypothetical protein
MNPSADKPVDTAPNVTPLPAAPPSSGRMFAVLCLVLGVCLGGAVSAGAFWLYQKRADRPVTQTEASSLPPEAAKHRYMARSLLHYHLMQLSALEPRPLGGQEFFAHPQTLIALVKSRLVINAALNQPEVAKLAVIKEQPDPAEWLESRIHADFSVAPEIMRIFITGDDPDELRVLVKAVTTAYLQEIINRDRYQTFERLNQLKEVATKYEEIVQQKKQIQRQLLARGPATVDSHVQAAQLRHSETMLADTEAELRSYDKQLRSLKVELAALQARQSTIADIVISDRVIEEYLRQDSAIADLAKVIAEKEKYIKEIAARTARPDDQNPSIKSAREEIQRLQDVLDAVKAHRRPAAIKNLRADAQRNAAEDAMKLEQRLASLLQSRQVVEEDLKRLLVETRRSQIDALDLTDLQEDMNNALDMMKTAQRQANSLEVELNAPPRMTLLEDTVVTRLNK